MSPLTGPSVRNTFAISILLFTLLAPGWLAYAFFQYRKQQVRQDVKERILSGVDPAVLVEWTFAKAEVGILLRWEHDREFEYRGQMYDVVEVFPEGDSIRYRCFWDRAETALNRQLDTLAARALGGDPAQRQAGEQLASFFQCLYCVANPVWILPDRQAARPLHLYFRHYGSAALPPPVPPPEENPPFPAKCIAGAALA